MVWYRFRAERYKKRCQIPLPVIYTRCAGIREAISRETMSDGLFAMKEDPDTYKKVKANPGRDR